MAAILAQRVDMPEVEACTAASGERAARGVAPRITRSPGAARVRPREERASC